ncbi:putative methyltransferase TARBP1 [Melipona quadrifasciata]|uniref:tRNA (guanosine(18)-2'-O)-methyltransferase TARBP1 n=1 Tax=Melipona quadrifasciata TaxID=166423 RepID=A0A0N0BD26_9HYME|nr:putative methyltransferase TARBP1 [Melipona quadrifasciata]
MDLHKHYMHTSTIDFSILELLEIAFKDDPLLLLHRLSKYYNTEIQKDNLHAKQLYTFQMILCYEYQLVFHTKKKHSKRVPNDLCLKTIENTLFGKKKLQNFTEHPILYDILILQLTLYCDAFCIEQHLINFRQLNADILNSNESKIFYMKILECFLESLQLKKLLYNDLELNLRKCLSSMYLEDVVSWLRMKENKEWRLFASILPKIISTFDFENVFPTIWDCALSKLDDLKDLLCALSILTDTCFSLNLKNKSLIYHDICYKEQLWLSIIQSLKSPIQQHRKQALFIMKQIIDFMSTVNRNDLKSKECTIIPFVCNQSIKTEISINDIKQNYFLILEALEEKQHHLILPALTHLPILIKGNEEHVACNNCFNSIWLQLIFERILLHDNNAIVKQGVLYVCKLPILLQDDQFTKLFIHILNNTFLYECQTQQEPKILNDIVTLFVHAEKNQAEFLNKVLQIMNEETWAPIPIFYMMKILRTVSSRVINHWADEQLNLIKSLIQKNLNMHSRILRITSQIELLKTISLSVKKINDLKITMNMLLEFSLEDIIVQNSFSWNIIISWLKEILVETDAINFIKFVCEEHSYQNSHAKFNPAKFAVIITIFHDAGLILQQKACPVGKVLDNWMSSLKGIDMRPYANVTHIFYIVEFMSHLLNLNGIETQGSIIQLLNLYINDALKFLLKHSKSIPYKFNYEELNRYLTAIVLIFKNGTKLLTEKEILYYVKKFKNESITIIQNIKQYTKMHYVYALYILYHTQNILCTNHTSFYLQPLLNICDIHISNNGETEVESTKRKIVSDLYILLARLLNQFLSKVETELWPQNIDWFKSISYLYEMGGNEIVPEIALMLKTMVNKEAIGDLESKSNLISIFTTCWRTTLLSTKNKIFFLTIKNLIGVIINNNFLVLPNIKNFVDSFLNQLLEEGNNVPKLKKFLLNEMKLLNTCYTKDLQESLLACLLHGHIFRKDKQIEDQVYLYITKHYHTSYPQHIQIIDHNNDVNIRAASVILLHQIINQDKRFGTIFLPIVLQKLEKYKNKRYFNHSYIHKIKHRIMQILLIIQPILTKNDNVILQEFLCNLMLLESNQHSVRIMQEWLLIRIFVENMDFHDKIWEFFEKAITTRPGCVSSIMCIIYHVSKLLSKDSQSNFILIAFNYITRCCLGQQYNMRLYAQIIFVKLYKILEELNSDHVTLQYKGLYNATIASLKDGLAKNSSKLQDDFYFSTFHPIMDYTLQTIYYELPRLTGMDMSDWITPYLFENMNFRVLKDHSLQLYNLNTSLSDTKTSSFLIKSSGDAESFEKNGNMEFEELNDIQKKINPLSTNLSHNDVFPTIRESISHKKILDEEGLIVVACLINRIPNLGGLARTCEIFNVKELVISSMSQIKNKEFQNLSVSAENWITITETKPYELCKYLLNKKDMGWSLVGVEQTANSTNLLNMKFEKKTILILGNEKDGIPANLIPLFDTCIEIPQVGVIRSLNVHVTGAICVWQYAKQHILT